MYCKYGFYTGKPVLMTEKDFKKYGNKPGLPIVAVQNVNRKIFNMQNAFKNRLGEKGKAFSVIIVPVNSAAAKIVFVVDEIIGDAVVPCGKKSAVKLAPGKADVKIAEISHFVS